MAKIRKTVSLDADTLKRFDSLCNKVKDTDNAIYHGLLENLSKFVNFAVRDALDSIEKNINKKEF